MSSPEPAPNAFCNACTIGAELRFSIAHGAKLLKP